MSTDKNVELDAYTLNIIKKDLTVSLMPLNRVSIELVLYL